MSVADRTTHSRSKNIQTAWIWLLLGILLAATFLRLYRLGDGLWLDEITTYLRYANQPYAEIVTNFDSENQHFLYSILAHTAISVFGQNAAALRLPAVLFGVASVFMVYLLGREVTNRSESLLAAALTAFSYHQVWFSQNARGYTGLLFWTLFSSWLLIRALSRRDKKYWIYYALSSALGLYTHLTMGFVIAGHFLSFILRWREIRRSSHSENIWYGLLLGFGGTALLALILYLPVLTDMRGAMGKTLTGVAEMWFSPLWTLRELFSGLQIGFSRAAIVLAALVVFVVGMVDYFRTRRIVLEFMLFGALIGSIVTIGLGHPLWPRFFFFAFGFVALVIMRGTARCGILIGKLLKLNPKRMGWIEPAGGILLVALSLLSIPFAYGPKQDFTGAWEYIEANRQAGDAVVTVNLTVVPYSQYLPTDWQAVDSIQSLQDARDQSARTWIVFTFPQVLEVVYPEIMSSIETDFLPIREFNGTLGDGTIYVVRADNLDESKQP